MRNQLQTVIGLAFLVCQPFSAICADKESILKAWSANQTKLDSGVTFEIEAATKTPKGGFTRVMSRNVPGIGTWPPKDSIVTTTKRIILRSDSIRTEDLSPMELPLVASATESVVQRVSRTETYDAKESRCMVLEDGQPFPQEAAIFSKRELNDARTTMLHPLYLATVPLNQSLSQLNIAQMKVVDSVVRDGDQLAQTILEVPFNNTSHIVRLWLDDRTGLLSSRIELVAPGEKLKWSAEIAYTNHEKLGYVPKSWTYTTFDALQDEVTSCGEVRVTRLELTPNLPSDCFRLTFPPGSVVSDFRDVEEKYLFAESDGQLTFITESSARKLLTERVPSILRRESSGNLVKGRLTLANIAVLVIALAAFVIRLKLWRKKAM